MAMSEELRIAYEDADKKHREEHARLFPVQTVTGKLELSRLESPTAEDFARLHALHEESERLRREWFNAPNQAR